MVDYDLVTRLEDGNAEEIFHVRPERLKVVRHDINSILFFLRNLRLHCRPTFSFTSSWLKLDRRVLAIRLQLLCLIQITAVICVAINRNAL